MNTDMGMSNERKKILGMSMPSNEELKQIGLGLGVGLLISLIIHGLTYYTIGVKPAHLTTMVILAILSVFIIFNLMSMEPMNMYMGSALIVVYVLYILGILGYSSVLGESDI